MGEELTGEHEIAEGGEELTGAPAVRAVPEKDGFHGGIGPSSQTPAATPEGRCSRTANTSLAVTVRGEDWAIESRWSGVSVPFFGGGRTQQIKGGSDSVEGIGRSGRRKFSLSNEIAVNEVLQLFGGLHGGTGPMLS